jgi:cytosine/adenosine deaminase-related metal-dependent hydrolase
VPAAPPHATVAALAGKAIWLSFSPVTGDPDSFDRLDPAAVVAQASAAGIRALEVRTTYGEFRELAPVTRPTVDALLDAAAARDIAVFAWTVPRGTNFEDLAAEVAAAAYRSPRGHGFAGLAVDLERGGYFLGDGPPGYTALTEYLADLRAALGPGYPLVATVEDPFLEHLSARDYPFAAIAASADALQPMAYWRMLSRRAVTPAAVRAALRGSYAAIRREAGRPIPIDVGGQTSAEGPRGAPPPAEIAAAVDEARRLGALGITFFDWGSTSREQFEALARSRW